jgi:hypothetical protein
MEGDKVDSLLRTGFGRLVFAEEILLSLDSVLGIFRYRVTPLGFEVHPKVRPLTYYQMPLCTRWWTTATVLTSALVQCQIVTPFQLFYSFRAVFVKSQVTLLCISHRAQC